MNTLINNREGNEMDRALREGHLRIQEWLPENEIDRALRKGHLRIQEWLRENGMESWSADPMDLDN